MAIGGSSILPSKAVRSSEPHSSSRVRTAPHLNSHRENPSISNGMRAVINGMAVAFE